MFSTNMNADAAFPTPVYIQQFKLRADFYYEHDLTSVPS